MDKDINPNDYLEENFDGKNIIEQTSQSLQDVAEAEQIAKEVVKLYNSYENSVKGKEYLVDGAVLRCNQATLGAFEMSDGEKIFLDVNEEQIKNLKGQKRKWVERVHTILKVKGSKMSTGESLHATVLDAKRDINIPAFRCNCRVMDDRNEEYKVIKANIDDCKKDGVCKYLMRLNDRWQNMPREDEDFYDTRRVKMNLETAKGEMKEYSVSVPWLSMTSMLFCRHGGVITPVASGQDAYKLMRFKYDWKSGGDYHSPYVTDEFLLKVLRVADALGVDPDDLMAIMAFESKLNPTAKNPKSSATGLIQLIEETANGLGITTAELAQMSAVDQLDYVYQYFFPAAGQMDDLGDMYAATLVGPERMEDVQDGVIFNKEENADEYDDNSGLDTNGDGIATKDEAVGQVEDRRDHYRQEREDTADSVKEPWRIKYEKKNI